ncbi:hypothetical protein DPM19_23215 [Actinomadura craniellae]|uniref:Uncharacterized protein n=1 Tax=Actinomadura craniellae TaxID=2231787 RepID=A0A365H1F8_9ACTN|nr:hypothetical protein DPM19_23215 [Actinomadura craniellae]
MDPVVIGPEVDQLFGGQLVEQPGFAQAATADQLPQGGQREGQDDFVGTSRAVGTRPPDRAALPWRHRAVHLDE